MDFATVFLSFSIAAASRCIRSGDHGIMIWSAIRARCAAAAASQGYNVVGRNDPGKLAV